ncbi:unnamed protein product [Closterium sp. NIES-53]
MTSLHRSGGSSDGGGGGSGGGGGRPSSRCGAVQWGVSGGGQMRLQQRQHESLTPQQLREWYTSRGGGGGSSGSHSAAVPLGVPGGGLPNLQRRLRETLTPQQLREWYVQQFGNATELPRWLELVRQGVDIFALDYDAIPTAMYALSFSAEGDCSRCVPPDPGIAAAALGASESGTPPGTAPARALHTFTLDSGASRCFFCDSTTLTPLPAPVPVQLADPSGGPVVARSSTVLPCPAVPSGSLSGLHLPSFSTNLVSTVALQDAMVTTTTLGGQRVSICTCTRTGRHLATFTCRPGSSLYTLATEPPQVAASAQVSASCQVTASCSCRLLSHQTLLWHHRLGHPSLPRLHGMHSRLLVSGLHRSLPPLPPLPAPPCLPCVEGQQRTAPHSSSFPPTTSPLQTLHMDVWGTVCVNGQVHEQYFQLVYDNYTRYTMGFPLHSKGEVPDVPITWICAVRLQLRERFCQDLPVLRLHSDRGGEFSSDFLRDFCRGEGILQVFSLPAFPHENGISECHLTDTALDGGGWRCIGVPGLGFSWLCPSSVPLRVPLHAPPESSLLEVPDPASDRVRAASPTVACLLATAVTVPSFESAVASALVAELLDFVAACHLNYASALVAESVPASPPSVGGECALGTDVLEDKQEEFECLVAAVPRFASMLLAPEGDPVAPDIPTPCSYAEAITGTYVDAVPPSRANIVDGMWIFRVKRPPGSPPAFKARYVARGLSQQQGVYYFQTFSPTPKMSTLRVLLHVAAQRDYELHSLDFSTTFLKGSLHEEIWLRRPPGFTGTFPAGAQWSLRRPVYDLRQAPREWHDTLRTTLAALGFAPSTVDPLLFLRTDTSLPLFYVLVYVDDLVFATADTEALTLVKSKLQKRHTCIDLGELSFSASASSSPRHSPLLSGPPSDESLEPSCPYPELVGCLMYVMTCTRPDLAYPLSLLSRYVAPGRHRNVHWDAAKRVLHYLLL